MLLKYEDRTKATYKDTTSYLSDIDWFKLAKTKKKKTLRVTVTRQNILDGLSSGIIDWSNIGEIDMDEVTFHTIYNHPLCLAVRGIFPNPCVGSTTLSTGAGQEYMYFTPYSKYLIGKWDSTRYDKRAEVFGEMVIDMIVWDEWVEKYSLDRLSNPNVEIVQANKWFSFSIPSLDIRTPFRTGALKTALGLASCDPDWIMHIFS